VEVHGKAQRTLHFEKFESKKNANLPVLPRKKNQQNPMAWKIRKMNCQGSVCHFGEKSSNELFW